MRRNAALICAACMAAVLLSAGMCRADEAADPAASDRLEAFAETVRELDDEYGFIPAGVTTVEAESKSGSFIWPDEIADHSEGVIFADVHDYDGDGEDELLVLRRQKGFINVDYGSKVSAPERREYSFEMYEYGELRGCYRAGCFVVGVFDIFDIFAAETSAIVFLKETDGQTEIFMETYKQMQDHPQNISLIRLRYDGGGFVDYSGFRYGCLFWGDGCVQYQQFKSLDAFDFLSYPGRTNDPGVEVIAVADTEEDESVKSALREGLAAFGLSLREADVNADTDANANANAEIDPTDQTDSSDLGDRMDSSGIEDQVSSPAVSDETGSSAMEDLDDLMDHSALGGYESEEGELRAMACICARLEGIASEVGKSSVRLDQLVYAPDPAGIIRGALGEE